jgi:hypothetical protein
MNTAVRHLSLEPFAIAAIGHRLKLRHGNRFGRIGRGGGGQRSGDLTSTNISLRKSGLGRLR